MGMLPQKINKFQSRKCHFLRFPQGTCLGNKYEGKCCEGGREESVYGIKQRFADTFITKSSFMYMAMYS